MYYSNNNLFLPPRLILYSCPTTPRTADPVARSYQGRSLDQYSGSPKSRNGRSLSRLSYEGSGFDNAGGGGGAGRRGPGLVLIFEFGRQVSLVEVCTCNRMLRTTTFSSPPAAAIQIKACTLLDERAKRVVSSCDYG